MQDKCVDEKCPPCKNVIEAHPHILKCQTESRIQIKEQWYTKFDNFLANDKYTPPSIRQILMCHVKSECRNEPLDIDPFVIHQA